jgi:protein tyrosine phosphatase
MLLDAIRRSLYKAESDAQAASSSAMDVDGESDAPRNTFLSEDPVPDIVDMLREARMSMIATSAQYTFTYRAILEGLANQQPLSPTTTQPRA